MRCDEFSKLLEGYLDDTLDREQRSGFRSHFAACSGCRELAFDREPTLMLTLAERPQPAPERIDRCVASVMAQVRQERLQHELRRRRPAWWMAAAAAAVVTVAGAVMWRTSTGVTSPTAAVAEPAAAATAAVELPPRIEIDMPGEGVRVYHQYADSDDDNAAVYFVVNPALES